MRSTGWWNTRAEWGFAFDSTFSRGSGALDRAAGRAQIIPPQDPVAQSTSYSLTASPATVTEGNQVTFTITRSGDKPAETVYFSTLSDGTATYAEGDYATTSGGAPSNIAVSFSSGTTSKTVTLNILNDGVADSGEQFRAIVQHSSSDPVSTFLARSSFVTINDAAPSTSYSLTASPTTVIEGNQVTFTITRSGDKPAETVYFSTLSDGTATYVEGDYTTTSGGSPSNIAVSFSSGTTSRTVTLNILNDGVADSGEQFRAIVQRSSSDPVSTYLDRSSFVTINDAAANTSYSLTASPTTVVEGNQVTFTITRSGDKPAETIYFSTLSDGTATYAGGDYATTSGGSPSNIAVSFSSGTTSQTVTLNILNDGVADSGEQFRAIVQRSTSDPVSTYLDRSSFVTINDAAAQATTYSLTPTNTTVVEGTQLTFTITRSGDKPAETIYFSTLSDGTATYAAGDYATTTGGSPANIAVNFSSGATSQTVTLNILNDGVADSGEQFRAIVQRSTSDPVSTYLDRSAFVTINDANSSGTTYSLTPSNPSITEGGQVTFTITRSGDRPAETLYVSTTQTEGYSNSKDYTGLSNQAVSFGAGQASATITVSTIDDSAPETRETFGLIVQRNAADSTSTYLAKSTFSIDDNDSSQQPLYSVVAMPSLVNENAGSIIFTITRTGSLTAETLYASTLNGSSNGYATNSGDYATNVNNLAVAFGAGVASKSVTVNITNDNVAEGDETFGFIVQRNAADPASTFVAKTNWTVHDDDGGSSSGYTVTPATYHVAEGAGTLTFTITRPVGLPAATLYASTVQDAGFVNSSDYATNVNNLSVAFAAGETAKTVTVSILNDSKPEQDETFGLIVQNTAADPIGTYLARTTWTIDDDDKGTVTQYHVIPDSTFTLDSSGAFINFSVTRDGDLPAETVYARTPPDAGSDIGQLFTALINSPITFLAGATTATLSLHLSSLVTTLSSARDYFLELFKVNNAEAAVGGAAFSLGIDPVPTGNSCFGFKLPLDQRDLPLTYITQRFGEADHGNGSLLDKHLYYSLDFHAPAHSEVLAQWSGEIVSERTDSPESEAALGTYRHSDRLGNYITVRYHTPDGIIYATYAHLYGSSSDSTKQPYFINPVTNTETASIETPVQAGTLLAYSGGTGGFTPHLHVTYGRSYFVYTNATETLILADGSSPDTVSGSPNTHGDPVSFAVGPLPADFVSIPVDNSADPNSLLCLATVTAKPGDSSAELSGGGGIAQVISTATGKVVDTIKNAGEILLDGFRSLSVHSLLDTSILHHTVFYTGTSFDDFLDAHESNTSTSAWGGLGSDVLIGGTGDDILTGGPSAISTSASAQTLTLQPGPEGQDEWITSVYYGGGQDDDRLRVGGWADYYHALIKFDLAGTSLPSHVDSATLRLYNVSSNGGSPTGMYVDELHTAWDENFRWNGHSLAYTTIGQTDAPALGWFDIDVTAAVNDWLANPSSNFGLQLRPLANSNNFNFFVSSDAVGSEVADRPELVLSWTGSNVGGTQSDDDKLDGGGGNDLLIGGAGNDTLIGGDGLDTASYQDALGGVSVNLALGQAAGSDGYDTLSQIENVVGSAYGDTLIGDAGANVLRGGGGADYLAGQGGDDTLIASADAASTLQGGTGNDSYYVSNTGDSVLEAPGEGNDRILASVSFTLSPGQEIETLSAIDAVATDPINLTGNALSQVVNGNDGANVLLGGGGADYLLGLGGDDTLIGNADAASTLQGGAGNDWYYVSHAGDSVVEAEGEGNDRILANVSYTMSSSQEIEALSVSDPAATTAINLTGNVFSQVIGGNAGANILISGGGNDYLVGLGGDDILVGNAGAASTLQGGTGNDWYYVSRTGDSLIEFTGEGNDRILTSVSYTLSAGQEIETLSALDPAATTALALTGNSLAQVINGNAGANVLTGGGGNDYLVGLGGDDILVGNADAASTLQGGTGNDWYYVSRTGDSLVELAGEGNDRIISSVSYTLTAGVEIETLLAANQSGNAAIDLIGNDYAQAIFGTNGANGMSGNGGADQLAGLGGEDVLLGGDGDDQLNGGLGHDVLNGGNGADLFVFADALGGGNVDTIQDLLAGTDRVALDHNIFTGLSTGTLAASAFVVGNAAQDADDRIIYNQAAGQIWFDADGSGAGDPVLFATLANQPTIRASDFVVI